MEMREIVCLIDKHKSGWLQQGSEKMDNLLKQLERETKNNWTQALMILYYALRQETNITDVSKYADECNTLISEISSLKNENTKLSQKLASMAANSHKKRLVKGDRIAYREDITKEKILALKEKGYTDMRIAAELGTSKSTIYRRLNKKEA
jgi:transcriptional regulator of acetoin/glycerol metabolism